MSTPSRDLTNFLNTIDRTVMNYNRFHTMATTIDVFYARASLLSETDRENLTIDERMIFYNSATQNHGLAFTLNPIIPFHTSWVVPRGLRFSVQVQQLKRYIELHAMQSVFYILNIKETIDEYTKTRCLTKCDDQAMYLLVDYSSIDIKTVLLSTEYYLTHSKNKIDAENLQWSLELLLNSCDDEMKLYLSSQLSFLPYAQHGGPTLFMIMVERIVRNCHYPKTTSYYLKSEPQR